MRPGLGVRQGGAPKVRHDRSAGPSALVSGVSRKPRPDGRGYSLEGLRPPLKPASSVIADFVTVIAKRSTWGFAVRPTCINREGAKIAKDRKEWRLPRRASV